MTTVEHFKCESIDGSDNVNVVAVTKQYGSLGPDPGREIERETLVADVSREYGEMLCREWRRELMFDPTLPRSNTFDINKCVQRNIDMWTGENADWGERLQNPIVF